MFCHPRPIRGVHSAKPQLLDPRDGYPELDFPADFLFKTEDNES